MKRIFLLASGLILFAGCFETDFNFKTVVKRDGSILREAKIDGRGANRFVVPEGPGWQAKSFETKGGQSILEDTYHHIYAVGRFRNASEMGSDYQLDTEGQLKDISDEERRNFIELGITEPFGSSVFSRNFVNVVKHRGIFASTFEYQEIFQNKGIVQLLLRDVKKEVVREKSVPLPKDEAVPPAEEKEPEAVKLDGGLLGPDTVEKIAEDRMVNDILKKFNFRSEVSLPGKIIFSNADSMVSGAAVWEFSAADFKDAHSRFTLEARSRMVEWRTIVLLIILLLVGLFGLSFVKTKPARKKRGSR